MTVQNQVTETIPMEAWEVGAELLEILSTGLYSEARDAIREYAQNGIDAGATTILVTVDGPRVVVRDDGTGMDHDTLIKARRFGNVRQKPRCCMWDTVVSASIPPSECVTC